MLYLKNIQSEDEGQKLISDGRWKNFRYAFFDRIRTSNNSQNEIGFRFSIAKDSQQNKTNDLNEE